MEIRLLDVAQQELDEAIEYYNGRSSGLGDQFRSKRSQPSKESRNFKRRGILILSIAGVRRIAFPTA